MHGWHHHYPDRLQERSHTKLATRVDIERLYLGIIENCVSCSSFASIGSPGTIEVELVPGDEVPKDVGL